MKGDFTRDTFQPRKHFSRVLMQQGRVTLDADHNEQTAILLHYLRTLAKDLIGPFGVPAHGGGFALGRLDGQSSADVTASLGRCYVDGFLVESDDAAHSSYLTQRHPPADAADFKGYLAGNKVAGQPYLVYLDVWERYVSWMEDASIRDVALGGADTCGRAEVVWQLKAALALETTMPATAEEVHAACEAEFSRLIKSDAERRGAATMTAHLVQDNAPQNACITAPESRYRGLENHLYRVEVHEGSDPASRAFSFKWSRDNGSVATPLVGLAANVFEVVSTRGFEPGIWVELSLDSHEDQGQPGWMLQLTKVEGNQLTADPATLPAGLPGAWKPEFALQHAKVRRWDQSSSEALALPGGVITVSDAMLNNPVAIDLEDGIQVRFTGSGPYCHGDYWLIPARVATGQIEWPQQQDSNGNWRPQALGAHGVEHHYAPLGFVGWDQQRMLQVTHCSCTLTPAADCSAKGGSPVIAKASPAQEAGVAESQRPKRRSP